MNITQNGTYRVNEHSGSMSAIFITGVTGGATMTLIQNSVALADGVLGIDSQYQVNHGAQANLYVVVAGASGTTAISFDVFGID